MERGWDKPTFPLLRSHSECERPDWVFSPCLGRASGYYGNAPASYIEKRDGIANRQAKEVGRPTLIDRDFQ